MQDKRRATNKKLRFALAYILGVLALVVVAVLFAPREDEPTSASAAPTVARYPTPFKSTPAPRLRPTLTAGRPSANTPAAFDMTAGIALIDDLIACDGPGKWDRSGLLSNLRRDEAAYMNTLRTHLEVCHLVNAQLADRPNRRLSESLATCIWYNEGHAPLIPRGDSCLCRRLRTGGPD